MTKEPTIKILVGYHKPSFLLKGKTFVPIWAGKSCIGEISKENTFLSEYEIAWMKEHCQGDDTGENISNKNRTYCEATVLYWMWKNYDKLGNPDYIGFLQYRRHWVFDSSYIKTHKISISNMIHDDYFTPDHQTKINLSDETIQREISGNDGIFCVNETDISVYDYKKNHHSQDVKYWDATLEIIKKDWPQYAAAAQKYNQGRRFVWSNCFIMKREDFLEYAPFLFDVLSKIDKMAYPEYENMTAEQMRVPAYVSESMLGIFWTYLSEKKKKLKSYPLLHVKNPFDSIDLLPKYLEPMSKTAIPVVFIADENYVKYTAVSILSIIKNASSNRMYDIIVLEDGTISQTTKDRVLAMAKPNVFIHFFNSSFYLENYNFKDFFHRRLNVMPYLKLFIHEILRGYEKAIFLDGDVMLLQDVAKLYAQNLKNCVIGAVQDAVLVKYQDEFWQKRRNYILGNEKMSDVTGYFNSGVLLLDLKKMREYPHLTDKFIKEACFKHKDRVHHDQDVLNFALQNEVMHLSSIFNFQLRVVLEPNIISASFRKYILDCYKNICVLHFDGDKQKPWKLLKERHKFIDLWWKYARQTPFYEEILYENLNMNPVQNVTQNITQQISQVANMDIVRDVANFSKNRFNYYRCRLLANLTFGRMRAHYINKKKAMKQKIQRVKTFMGGGKINVYKYNVCIQLRRFCQSLFFSPNFLAN